MTKEKRQGIYLSKESVTTMGDTTRLTVSGRVNQIIQRYDQIITGECPALLEREWMAIFDVMNGTIMDDPHFLWAEIEDGDRLEGLGEKWGIDAIALSRQIREMSLTRGYAILEIVKRFWEHHDEKTWSTDQEKILSLGAKIKDESILP